MPRSEVDAFTMRSDTLMPTNQTKTHPSHLPVSDFDTFLQ
jgi:hypothetical protein